MIKYPGGVRSYITGRPARPAVLPGISIQGGLLPPSGGGRPKGPYGTSKRQDNVPNTGNAMNVNFNNGNVNNNDKTNDNYVRPVRGGACKNDVFSFSGIYRRYEKCRKRKRNTHNALRFEMNLEDNICKLRKELKEKTYQPARSVCFVEKKPKLREIFAADFRDRIAHHILVGYLEKIYEPEFIYDSWACRKNRGNHGAVKRLRKFLRKVTQNNTKEAYYLQLDIRSFFMNIDKNILYGLIKKKTSNSDILWLMEVILFNDCTKGHVMKGNPELFDRIPPHKTLFNTPENKGLPIGNLTSQFFANVYLNELDQFVKHGLKCRYYIRYADDSILLSQDKEELKLYREKIEGFLREKLGLELNGKRESLKNVSFGIDFLGYITRPEYTLVRNRVVNNFKEKLRKIEKQAVEYGDGVKIIKFNPALVKRINEITASYFSHFKHADAYNLKKKLNEKYRFIGEIRKHYRLALAHCFVNLESQKKFFSDAINSPEYKYDDTGQLHFTFSRNIVMFQVGNKYHTRKRSGRAVIPLNEKDKFIKDMLSKGYSVYVVNQKKDIRFDHLLLTRVLERKYEPVNGGNSII